MIEFRNLASMRVVGQVVSQIIGTTRILVRMGRVVFVSGSFMVPSRVGCPQLKTAGHGGHCAKIPGSASSLGLDFDPDGGDSPASAVECGNEGR